MTSKQNLLPGGKTWRLTKMAKCPDPNPDSWAGGVSRPAPSNSPDTNSVSCKFNSNLTPSPQREHHIPQLKGFLQDCPCLPSFRGQSPVQVVTCSCDQLAIDQRFPQRPPLERIIC